MLAYRSAAVALFSSVLALCSDGQTSPAGRSAAEVMHHVAESQDTLQSERSQIVYDQTIKVITRRTSGKVVCQQETQYIVAPKEKTTERTLVSTRGKYWRGGRFVDFDKDPGEQQETLDTGIAKSFRDDLTHSDSKDGLAQDLFPLTTEQQKDLEFELTGEQLANGRPAYVVRFRPKDRKDYGWAGEALVDKEDLQPVRVYTQMARKLPFFVRTMLGTDVPGLGFTTQYTRVGKGLWFPSSFGTEFKVHAVYFFHRTITVSMENKNFRHTSVDAQIHFEPAP